MIVLLYTCLVIQRDGLLIKTLQRFPLSERQECIDRYARRRRVRSTRAFVRILEQAPCCSEGFLAPHRQHTKLNRALEKAKIVSTPGVPCSLRHLTSSPR